MKITIEEIARKHGTDKLSHDYIPAYSQYFDNLRKDSVNLLEIGVRYGNSIWTWHEYFEKGNIYGMDILNNAGYYKELHKTYRCPDGKNRAMWHHESTGELVKFTHLEKKQQAKLNEQTIQRIRERLPKDRFDLIIGDQSKVEDLAKVSEACEEGFDIIIDDGSHAAAHQQITLNYLFKHLKPGGIYVIEDLMMGTQRHNRGIAAGAVSTNSVLKSFKSTGKIGNRYITDSGYLEENIESIDWPLSGTGNNKICFIRKVS